MIIAALDVGSSKICCFIAHAGADGAIRVVGAAQQASDGVRRGNVVDMQAAQGAILSAVIGAEELSEERINKVLVNLSGGGIRSHIREIDLSIGGHEVTANDLRHARERSLVDGLPEDRELLHCLPVGYAIDGNLVEAPLGMVGENLGVRFHHAGAAVGPLRNLRSCIARCHLEIEGIVVTPYASGLSCLDEDDRNLGAVVIDMGGGTTTVAVFQENRAVFVASVPVGGSHVTNDIARGLSTPVVHAERMKTLYGTAVPSPSDDRDVIDVPLVGEENHEQPNHVPRSLLVGIVRPRLEETFELVRDSLESSGALQVAGRRIVLTGGASQLAGAALIAERVLGSQVRFGRPLAVAGLAEAMNGPAFSACAGLLRYGVDKQVGDESRNENRKGRLSRLGQWLKSSF